MSEGLFTTLSEADRQALFAKAEHIAYQAGEVILREGEVGTKLFIIDSGVVAITRTQGETVELLNVLTRGEYFGEMALLSVEPRSATVRAVEPCQCTVFSHDDFQHFVHLHPRVGAIIYRNFAITLSERLRHLTEKFERLHPRDSVERPADAAPAKDWMVREGGESGLLTPAMLIHGIAELLHEPDLPPEKRAYFEKVLRNQVTELTGWLKDHE